MNKARTRKLIYVIAAVTLLAMLIPAALPVGVSAAEPAPSLAMTLVTADGTRISDPEPGWNISGSTVEITATGNTSHLATNGPWTLVPVATEPTSGAGSAQWIGGQPANSATTVQITGIWGDYKVEKVFSTSGYTSNYTATIEKKFGQIDHTDIGYWDRNAKPAPRKTATGYTPVVWNESGKYWSANATIFDNVYGIFYEKDANPPYAFQYPIKLANGAILNWYLLPATVNVDMSPNYADVLKARMAGYQTTYGTPSHVSFTAWNPPAQSGGSQGTGTYTKQTVAAGADPQVLVDIYAKGEQGVKVVVVPEYPFGRVNIMVDPEIISYDFYTTQMDVVPQVRWAGEKIVLEKYFGTGFNSDASVQFTIQNQSIGSLEPMSDGASEVKDSAVWTKLVNGWARCILVATDVGVASVTAALYDKSEIAQNKIMINQHFFTVYFLKLERLSLGDVVGKRAGHASGLWETGNATLPSNPWDPTGLYNGLFSTPSSLADQPTQELNVSQDALLRARVQGWFTSSNPSVRPERRIWTGNSNIENPQTPDLLLPSGRWILPDDWPVLAGPNWKQIRMHWDIMCDPDGSVGSSVNTVGGKDTGFMYYIDTNNVKKMNPPAKVDAALTETTLGNYYMGPTPSYIMPPAKLVGARNIIGPFSPGLEEMTPMGWVIPNNATNTADPTDALRKFGANPPYSNFDTNTVVPDGKLTIWDAPMPPAKIIFQINAKTDAATIYADQVGYFKPADKKDIYYIIRTFTNPNTQEQQTFMIYTNPFYQEMVPANEYIPAFINNGGYDWNSFDSAYGPYIFWEFINQHQYLPAVATSDPAGHPTNVEVYSDNHGEAMVWLNGNWNLDLLPWMLETNTVDIPFDTVVGKTTVQATADYPYSRVHQAIQSNEDVKTWKWGGRVLGTDRHVFPGAGSAFPTATTDTRMVLSVGPYETALTPGTSLVGTYPNQASKSTEKMVWVWVTDRDGKRAGVNGAKVTWAISSMTGTGAKIASDATGRSISGYNDITQKIYLYNGFLALPGDYPSDPRDYIPPAYNPYMTSSAMPNGSAVSADLYSGVSYLRAPTSIEAQLFAKFWGSNPVPIPGSGGTGNPPTIGTSTIRADASNYVVSAVKIRSQQGYAADVTVNIGITCRDFDLNMVGQIVPGTIHYQTNVNFNVVDALDDGIRVGDANCDGMVNMGDVTTVERMILGYTPVTSNAIANEDGTVDMGTVVKIERTILGLK